MPTITCTAPLSTIGSKTIVRLPKAASAQFPSRGMAMADGTVNGVHFFLPLEPDGKGSHWFAVDKAMRKAVKSGTDTVSLAMEPAAEWPEPTLPADVRSALDADAKAHATWQATTPMARWDWIRWIRSTNNPDTRAKRITVARSKLRSGMKRPCCFNRSMCTEPEVSKSGVLLESM